MPAGLFTDRPHSAGLCEIYDSCTQRQKNAAGSPAALSFRLICRSGRCGLMIARGTSTLHHHDQQQQHETRNEDQFLG